MVDEHQSFQVRILAGSSPKLIKLGRRSCEPPTQVARVRGDSVKIRGCVCIRGSSAAQIHVRASVRAPPPVRSVFLKGAQSASDHRIHLFGWDLPVPVKGRRGPFQPSLQPVDAQVFPLAREACIPFLAPRSYRQMPGLCGTNRALCCLTSEVERDPVHSTRYGRRRHLRRPICCRMMPVVFSNEEVWSFNKCTVAIRLIASTSPELRSKCTF